MAHADRNTLHHSRIEMDRQQREEQPEVPGASGAGSDDSPQTASEAARKRHGKTRKHTSDDTPEE
jgi:hypothetical protein